MGAACTVCSPCNEVYPGFPGYYTPSSQAGIAACEPCPAGTFLILDQTPSGGYCQTCDNATWSAAGLTHCSPCPSGWEASPDHSACTPCDPGHFLASSSGTCQLCPSGTFQPQSAQSDCLVNPAGQKSYDNRTSTFGCPSGQFLNSTTVVTIVNGFSSSILNQQCSVCPFGTYNPIGNQSQCTVLPTGSYGTNCTALDSTTTVVDGTGCSGFDRCSAGLYFAGSRPDGGNPCKLCPPGSTSTVGSSTCTPCGPGTYQPLWGQPECPPCPDGRSEGGATQVGQCLCSYNYYQQPTPYAPLTHLNVSQLPHNQTDPSDYVLQDYASAVNVSTHERINAHFNFTCVLCPAGAVCTGDNMPQARSGFWRTASDPSHFYQCAVAGWCPRSEGYRLSVLS